MEVLESLLQAICEICNPELVILYGQKSHVASQELKSLDFCIVAETTDKRELQKRLYLGIDTPIPFNVLLYTHDEWTKLLQDPDSYAYRIREKGRVLYER